MAELLGHPSSGHFGMPRTERLPWIASRDARNSPGPLCAQPQRDKACHLGPVLVRPRAEQGPGLEHTVVLAARTSTPPTQISCPRRSNPLAALHVRDAC